MKISKGVGGRGSVVSIERRPHPDSHFEPSEVRIRRLDDGTFNIRKEKRLKAKHDNSEGFMGSYREPEECSAGNCDEMMQKVGQHFGAKAKAKKSDNDGEEY
jgi:hypothetical protein